MDSGGSLLYADHSSRDRRGSGSGDRPIQRTTPHRLSFWRWPRLLLRAAWSWTIPPMSLMRPEGCTYSDPTADLVSFRGWRPAYGMGASSPTGRRLAPTRPGPI